MCTNVVFRVFWVFEFQDEILDRANSWTQETETLYTDRKLLPIIVMEHGGEVDFVFKKVGLQDGGAQKTHLPEKHTLLFWLIYRFLVNEEHLNTRHTLYHSLHIRLDRLDHIHNHNVTNPCVCFCVMNVRG